MKRARLVLAEDHAAVADQLRDLLDHQFEVTAVVSDGFALVGAAMVLKPDVIVADITLPGIDGITAAEWILKSDRSARIVFVTVHTEAELIRRAIEMGALGYVVKITAGDDLVPAVQAALNGRSTFDLYSPG